MAYSIRKVVTIDPSKVGGSNLTDLRMLFKGTYSYLATIANGGVVTSSLGYDIIFMDSSATAMLDFELVSYDPTTGTVEFWVKTPANATIGTAVNLFAGNSAVTVYQGTTNTWSGYGGAYHTASGASLGADSTANANNAAINGAPTAVTGQIGGGAHFATQNVDFLSAPDAASLHLATPFTISAWVKIDSRTGAGGQGNTIAARPSGSNLNYYLLLDQATGAPTFFYANGSNVFMSDSVGRVSLGVWTHVAVVVTTGATPRADFYVNGAFTSTQNAFLSLPSVGAGALVIGGTSGGGALLGAIDELHLAPANFGAYITAEYNNQLSPSTFYTITSAISYSESASGGVGFSGTCAGRVGFGAAATGPLGIDAATEGSMGVTTATARGSLAINAATEGQMHYNTPAGTVPLVIKGSAITSIGTVPFTCVTGSGTGGAVISPTSDPGFAY